MNWDAIGAIGELAGALAVVLTLLFLARQIREASRQITLTSSTDVNTLFNEAFAPIYNNEHNMKVWVHGLRDPTSLSDDDLEIFFLFMSRLMAVFDTVVEHYFIGTTADERFENYRDFIIRFLQTPGGQAWMETKMYTFSARTSTVLGLS